MKVIPAVATRYTATSLQDIADFFLQQSVNTKHVDGSLEGRGEANAFRFCADVLMNCTIVPDEKPTARLTAKSALVHVRAFTTGKGTKVAAHTRRRARAG